MKIAKIIGLREVLLVVNMG